ncbi:MAG: hypothetical protein MJZ64_03605 [Paludibacteraceae bacterium]|nr:hypothetical protein [Paludibacteraceae bacterium]
MEEVVKYIIHFLLRGNDDAACKVAYCPESASLPNNSVIILGDGLAQPLHYPDMQPPQVEQLPDGRYVIHTDLIYNTFFFISRAEELLNDQRDRYGRFLATYSILGQDNRLQHALIDEYSQLLLTLLCLPVPEKHFSAINLTHDIDTIAYYRHLRGAVGGIARGQWRKVLASLHDIHNDPAFTFPWMMEQDRQIAQADVIFFVKDTPGCGLDYPQYSLAHNSALQSVYDEYRMSIGSRLHFGLHSSAYENASLAYRHNCPLINYQLHRSHYLSCSIKRMQQLVDFGVTDDYTMAFPDRAGFRLQTTCPVRWINPTTRKLTSLTLHPLTIMDCTLSNSNYMNLDEDEALTYAEDLLSKIRLFNGEVNLLWHNTVFADNSYHRQLYPKILQLLQ